MTIEQDKTDTLKREAKRSGFVAVVGKPNVGKSTLTNVLVGEKIAIATHKAQTTRTLLRGILNSERGQAVFIDTPGFCTERGVIHRVMRRISGSAPAESDLALWVLNLPKGPGEPKLDAEDKTLLEKAKQAADGVVCVINKNDRISPKERLLPWLEMLGKEHEFLAMIPTSATRGDGIERLLNVVYENLPEGPALFPQDLHTDLAEKFLCEELVREQILLLTHQEVPHSVAIVIDSFEDERSDNANGGLCRLEGKIVVDRKSQKGILVGRRGEKIKTLSQRARIEMESLLQSKVFLRLSVVVDENWTTKEGRLQRYGLSGREQT